MLMSLPDDVPNAAELGRSYQQVLAGHSLPEEDSETHGQSEPASVSPPPLLRIIEALLFVGGEPLTHARVQEIIRGLSREQFTATVQALNQDYRLQARPYAIVGQGEGYVLALKPRYHQVHEKLYGAVREARLSTAAIDVLALVAYRQPATKQEIDSLRGVESGALLRQLVRRGLACVVRRADAQEREVCYGTTPRFLELFGLSSLEDLPRTQELEQI
jgi:segregation and condensation protein B